MWGPGKQASGTILISNDLVTHQAHKNGQLNDLKWSKTFSIGKETQE